MLRAVENVGGKTDLHMSYALQNMLWDRKDVSAQYNMLPFEIVMDAARVLKDVIQQSGHAHILCSPLQFDLCFKTLS